MDYLKESLFKHDALKIELTGLLLYATMCLIIYYFYFCALIESGIFQHVKAVGAVVSEEK